MIQTERISEQLPERESIPMQPIINLSFPHGYEIETDLDWTQDCKRYYYPGAHESGKDGLSVVISANNKKWMGVFEFSYPNAHSGIYSMPNPDFLAVVSAGLGTVVDSKDPKHASKISVFPIMNVVVHEKQEKLLFMGFTDFVAYSANGLDWTVKGLSWDGIQIESMDGTGITIKSWNSPGNCYEHIYLDLTSRKCIKAHMG
jgi:hypothetical protein